MVIVEARYPDGRLLEVTEVSLTQSGLSIMITDNQGHQVFISRHAWMDVVKAVNELLHPQDSEVGRH